MKGLRAFMRVVRRFVPHLAPLWDKILLRLLLTQCLAFLNVCAVMATANIFDRAIPDKSPRALYFWVGFTLVLGLTGALCNLINGIVGAYVALKLDIRFKDMMLRQVQRLSLRFFDSRPVGEHMYRISADTTDASALIGNLLPTLVERLQGVATALALVAAVNPRIAVVVSAYIVVYFAYSHFLGSRAREISKVQRMRLQEVNARLQQNLSGFAIAKSYARERYDLLRYVGRWSGATRAAVRLSVTMGLLNGGALLLEGWFLTLAHALFCGMLVVNGNLSIGEYAAVGQMMVQLTLPLQSLVMTLQTMRVQAVPAERMLDTLDVRPTLAAPRHPKRLEAPKGELVFENVGFRYRAEGPDVLRDLSFRVPAGSKLALVGLSGAGKTSVFNLLMRYYDPTEGRVLVDGVDLRDLDLASYRDHVGLVLQDSFLFSATIRDNLLFGRPDASGEALLEAIRRAGLEEFIRALPEGLDTVLAEGGNLSAGIKQRLSIARALIRNPRFLFLDEATAALDPTTEAEVLHHLRRVETGRTRIVIAHNIASVTDADMILVLEGGCLAQCGPHSVLLGEEGAYARMWAAEEAGARRLAAPQEAPS